MVKTNYKKPRHKRRLSTLEGSSNSTYETLSLEDRIGRGRHFFYTKEPHLSLIHNQYKEKASLVSFSLRGWETKQKPIKVSTGYPLTNQMHNNYVLPLFMTTIHCYHNQIGHKE